MAHTQAFLYAQILTALEQKRYYEVFVLMMERTRRLEAQKDGMRPGTLSFQELEELARETADLQRRLTQAVRETGKLLEREWTSRQARLAYAQYSVQRSQLDRLRKG